MINRSLKSAARGMIFADGHAPIYVAGGDTLIGAAILRALEARGHHVVGGPPHEPDLSDAAEVDQFFRRCRPAYVIFAAGRSAGIEANRLYPADLIIDNLGSALHVIRAAHNCRVNKLLYLASSCSYPKQCPQPMQVGSLMTGPLEPTNEAYAMAKLAGLTLCQAYARQYGDKFICGIPANAFGIEDDFTAEGGHVIPALIARMHVAKRDAQPSIEIWGTGTPRREFIFADDLADACLFAMAHYENTQTPINLGPGHELSIKETAELIRDVLGYTGQLTFNVAKPDGMPLKSLDTAALSGMGWHSQTPIRRALEQTYKAYLARERTQQPTQQRTHQQETSHVRASV